MNKLNTREELTAFRKVCEEALKCETKQILVCGGTGCVAGGSLDIFAKLKELLEEKNIPVEVERRTPWRRGRHEEERMPWIL